MFRNTVDSIPALWSTATSIYRPFGLVGNASYMFTAQNSPWSTATRYSVYWPVLAVPNKVFNVILYVYYGRIWRFGCGLANKIGLHLNREQNNSLSYIILETRTAKVVIRFEVRSFLSRGYFLSCSHLAIPAKLHSPKGYRINESLLYFISMTEFREAVAYAIYCVGVEGLNTIV